MNRLIICFAAVLVASIGLAQDKQELKDQKDKASYSIGLELGTSLKKGKMDVNTDKLLKGLKDGLSGEKPLLTEEQVKETMTALQKEMMEKQAAANKEEGEKNAAAGEKFLAENKKKDGRENDRQRAAIQSPERGDWGVAQGDRHGGDQLQGHDPGWNGIR